MKRLLVILLLLGAFLFYPYAGAGQEEEKGKVVVIDPDDTAMIENWPQWLFLHGYTSHYDSNWMNNYRKRPGAIVIRKPPSFGESFLSGFSRAFSKGMDNYYREKEYKQYTKAMLGLLELKWASEGRYSNLKRSQADEYRNERIMSPEERWANLERIEELGRIIKQKKERARLDKLFREGGWLDKDRIEYLNRFYPLPKETEVKAKPKPDIFEYMKSIGAIRSWQYKTQRLNEYLKSHGLSLVPGNVDVNQVHGKDWIIYWDGKEWTKKNTGEMKDEQK